MWVAERDGTIIGFASSGRIRDDDAVPGSRELYAIYVLAAHYGSGAGQALLDAAIGGSGIPLDPRRQPASARVLRPQRLRPDGAVKDDDQWGDPVREIRMVRGDAARSIRRADSTSTTAARTLS